MLAMKSKLGLRENWVQFTLLVFVNALVGGLIGLERSIIPRLASESFHVTSTKAILTFIVIFGISKAISNYFAGHFANELGRRQVLLLGWFIAVPIPFIFMWAPNWYWILGANVLLGINQGLTWSSTVTMKIDLVGEQNRGLAMGINEFAGYAAMGISAFLSSWIAANYGLRPYPFYMGIAFVGLGFFFTWVFIRDTMGHVQHASLDNLLPRLKSVFWDTTWRHPNLGSVSQAGLINNLNDGMVWGLFPMLLAAKGFSLTEIGVVTGLYPLVWGIGQLATGKLADLFCPKILLVLGMLLQGFTLIAFVFATTYVQFAALAVMLGIGTALVYPTFLTAISMYSHPMDRAKSLGVFRLWRDLGYSIGALLTGVLISYFDYTISILVIALLTIFSAAIVWKRMFCRELFI